MKKLLTVTLVLVFALALVFALGCNKKEAPAETSTEQGMDSSMPATGDSMSTTTTTTTTTTTSPDTTLGGH